MTQAPEFPHDRLRDEVRLLGALLGEVIRDEGGQNLYDRIEAVRRASVAYHRDPASDDASELERLLGELSLDQSLAQFERGIALARQSQQLLQSAEQKVQLLLQQQHQESLLPFEPEQGD
mgnify:CR=1 FL=1